MVHVRDIGARRERCPAAEWMVQKRRYVDLFIAVDIPELKARARSSPMGVEEVRAVRGT